MDMTIGEMPIGRIVPPASATANQSRNGKDGGFASFFNKVAASVGTPQPEATDDHPVATFADVSLRDVMAAVDQETESIRQESLQMRRQAMNAYGAVLGM